MSRDPRKKERQRLKRKQKKLQMRKVQAKTALQRIAAEGGTLECWITPDWEEKGMAAIQVLGHTAAGRSAFAAFLVDIWCVGLKDAFGRSDVPASDFREARIEPMIEQGHATPVNWLTAKALVASAVRFSRQNGFRLPHDWEKWASIFGRDMAEEARDADLSDFGVDGGLRYMGTEEFLRTRLVGCTFEEFLSRPDVQWVMQGQAEFLEGDDEEDEDDDDIDDDPIDEDFKVDEEQLEMAGKVLDDAVAQVIRNVRTWCSEKEISPHPELEKAAKIAIVTVPLAMETSEGNEPVEPDQIANFLISELDSSEQEGVRDALNQILECGKERILIDEEPDEVESEAEVPRSLE
jgi:hypothetical protein